MADRYPTRPGAQNPPNHESDPLAELARLIGQTDPFASFARDNAQQQADPHQDSYQQQDPGQESSGQDSYADEPPVEDNRPSWLRKRLPPQAAAPDPRAAHPPAASQSMPPWPPRPEIARTPDPARYNDVLYGQQQAAPAAAWPAQGWPASEAHNHPSYQGEQQEGAAYDQHYAAQQYDAQHYDPQHYAAEQYDQSYEQDAYPYRAEEDEPVAVQPRNSSLMTAIIVLSLAIVGTAGAFTYRYYRGAVRSGDAPIIYADKGPTKVTPAATADASGKINDRVGASGERLVPREEQPVNVATAAQQQPRVVFPPPGQAVSPGGASAAPVAPPVGGPPSVGAALQAQQQATVASDAGNGTMDGAKRVKVLTIRNDNAGGMPTPPITQSAPSNPAAASSLAPSTAPAAPTKRAATSTQPPKPFPTTASGAPLSLSPNAARAEPNTRVANVAPTSPSPGGGYVVQVSSQRNESDARNSYRAMQSKYSSVLGTREPFIKRVDLGEKGIYYRAMVGPFASSEEASQLCGNLKSAGGQCVVQRN